MWLINAESRRLEEFPESSIMKDQYAILSHTWEQDEVRFDEMHLPSSTLKAGYRKIDLTCKQAIKDGLEYAWVDTCCIDKRSSAELSEAINSMYRWYYDARVCYAFLSDSIGVDLRATGMSLKSLVTELPGDRSDQRNHGTQTDRFTPRWFSRGWTLQELIAPKAVTFYDADWEQCGTKNKHLEALAEITGIDPVVLRNRNEVHNASIAKKMSWAASRITTRQEDVAYCLLGIFGVNMPLLYGEGARAFTRLQEEIIRSDEMVDHSLLAWEGIGGTLLAPSPSRFHSGRNVFTWRLPQRREFDLSKSGLRITLHVRAAEGNNRIGIDVKDVDKATSLVAILDCANGLSQSEQIAILLRKRPTVASISQDLDFNSFGNAVTHADEAIYDRVSSYYLMSVTSDELSHYQRKTITIGRTAWTWPSEWQNRVKIASPSSSPHLHLIHSAYQLSPGQNSFDNGTRILSLSQFSSTAFLASIINHKDVWISLRRAQRIVDDTPILELSCLEDSTGALFKQFTMSRGVENILVQNERLVLKAVANIVACEGIFMWNVEFSASIVYELEGREISKDSYPESELANLALNGSGTDFNRTNRVQRISSGKEDDNERDETALGIEHEYESVHRSDFSGSPGSHDRQSQRIERLQETLDTVDEDLHDALDMHLAVYELDADDSKPGMRVKRTVWPYSDQFPLVESDCWQDCHTPRGHDSVEAEFMRLQTLLNLEWGDKDDWLFVPKYKTSVSNTGRQRRERRVDALRLPHTGNCESQRMRKDSRHGTKLKLHLRRLEKCPRPLEPPIAMWP